MARVWKTYSLYVHIYGFSWVTLHLGHDPYLLNVITILLVRKIWVRGIRLQNLTLLRLKHGLYEDSLLKRKYTKLKPFNSWLLWAWNSWALKANQGCWDSELGRLQQSLNSFHKCYQIASEEQTKKKGNFTWMFFFPGLKSL